MARPHLAPGALEAYQVAAHDIETSTLHRLGRPALYMVKRRLWNSWLQYASPQLALEAKQYLEAGFHKCERTIQNDDESELPESGGEQIAA